MQNEVNSRHVAVLPKVLPLCLGKSACPHTLTGVFQCISCDNDEVAQSSILSLIPSGISVLGVVPL